MIAIVVLQYGRWKDTVACLQSLVPAVQANRARVIVVDNRSPDDSVDQLHSWIRNGLPLIPRPVHDTVAPHWWPLAGAGSEWRVIRGGAGAENQAAAQWTLIESKWNRGFAGGMNEGIREALRDDGIDAIWLLNNDTVVAPTTIDALQLALDSAPHTVGQFGTTVCY